MDRRRRPRSTLWACHGAGQRLAAARRTILVSIVVVGLVGSGVAAASRHAGVRATVSQFTGGDVHVPAHVRITVEVFNATKRRGLGRRAMLFLRDQGFDVVTLGTDLVQRDSTLVVMRTAHPDWARLVARALGGARVEAHPDSSRDVDLSVYVGSAWRPPPQPFHP